MSIAFRVKIIDFAQSIHSSYCFLYHCHIALVFPILPLSVIVIYKCSPPSDIPDMLTTRARISLQNGRQTLFLEIKQNEIEELVAYL